MSRTIRGVAGVFYCYLSGKRLQITHGFAVAVYIFLVVNLLSGFAVGQDICRVRGYVFDDYDGQPVNLANVFLLNTNFRTLTNISGQFELSEIPEGVYQISAVAEGYERAKVVQISILPDASTAITIYLRRKVYYLGETNVASDRGSVLSSTVAVLTRNDIIKKKINSLPEALGSIRGVFIQESGVAGSPTTVSIRGCEAKHVVVLVDGQRINPAGTGVADISTIPLEMIEKIEVFKGGQSARFGADAIGGVIDISTISERSRLPRISWHQQIGKWGSLRQELGVQDFISRKNISTRLSLSAYTTNGDFAYDYSVSPHPGMVRQYIGSRQNADVNQKNGFMSVGYHVSPSVQLQFSGQLYHAKDGMPGPVSMPDSTAWKIDKRALAHIELKKIYSPAYIQNLSVGFSRFEQYFNNVDNPRAAYRFESRFTNDISTIELTNNLVVFRGNDAAIGLSAEKNILYHDDIMHPIASKGRLIRNNMGLFASDRYTINLNRLRYIDAATISLSWRYDYTKTKRDGANVDEFTSDDRQWSERVGLTFVKGHHSKIILRSSYGTSYRLPSGNALFWKGDVRSNAGLDLRPEKSEQSEAGVECQIVGKVNISAGMTYFHSFIRDLIVWQPSSPGNIWKPVNLDAARITGHEEFVTVSCLDDRIQLRYQNTITVPKNKKRGINAYAKDLTFKPRYVTQIGLKVSFWKLFSNYEVRLVGKRYALSSNTKWYDAYRVDNAGFGVKLRVAGMTGECICKIKNVNNENYVLIGHYPMPGREYGIYMTLSYSPKY